jgi:aminoglycoside phosphotransferase (APT) family kinase protein
MDRDLKFDSDWKPISIPGLWNLHSEGAPFPAQSQRDHRFIGQDMNYTNSQLLGSVKVALAKLRVNPKVRPEKVLLLCELAIESVLREGKDSELQTELVSLIDRGLAMLGPLATALPKNMPEPRQSDDNALPEYGGAMNQLAGLVSKAVEAQNNPEPGEFAVGDLRTFVEEAVKLEIRLKSMPQSDTKANEPAELSLEDLDPHGRYFADKLGVTAGFRFLSMEKLSGGFSNDTYRLDYMNGADRRSIILRVAQSRGLQWPYAASLEEEFPFLQWVANAGIPVAAPLWYEPDTRILGSPFSAGEFVEGELLGDTRQADRPINDAVYEKIAGRVAVLHSSSWRQDAGSLPSTLVPNADVGPGEAFDLILTRLKRYHAYSGVGGSPVVNLLFDWLERHRSIVAGPVVVTHGDLGFHNWLFLDDEPKALLDWETVCLASPAKDLANLRDAVVPPEKWQIFIDAYVSCGGCAPSDKEMELFGVLRILHAVICTNTAMGRMFAAGNTPTIDLVEIGLRGRDFYYRSLEDWIPILVTVE